MAAPALMLATQAARMPGGPEALIAHMSESGDWRYEAKLDGIRALVQVSDGNVRISNRTGRDITYRYPDVVGSLSGFGTSVVLDGEIVCTDDAGRPDFARIHRRDAQGNARAATQLASSLPAQFVAFDVLDVGGVDLRMLPYLDRRRHLLEQGEELGRHGVLVPPSSQDGAMMWQVVQMMGLEGLVAKRAGSRYVGRRSPDWVKIKMTRRLSALVSGYDAGEGSRASTFGALRLSLLDAEGNLVSVGSVGSGFTEAMVRDLWGRLRTGAHPIVVEVEYLEMSPSGHLRQPVMKGVRFDVPPSDCTLTQVEGQPIG